MLSTVIHRMAHTATASAHASAREDFRLNDAINKISDSQATNTAPSGVGGVELIASVVALFLILLLLSWIGQLLWNSFIAGANGSTGLITVARPADNVWQILGLYIFVSLICG